MIVTFTRNRLRIMHRQGVTAGTVCVMAALTMLAGLLGWASQRTIVGVYDESVKLLAQRGLPAPPNPFLLKPQLSMLSNMSIYVTMIGALVAVIAGHLAVADDHSTGTGRLVFSRPVHRQAYATAVITAPGVLLGLAMAISALLSAVAFTAVNKAVPSAGDVARLVGFALLSWVYLWLFAVVGSLMLLATRRRSLGLLTAIGVWLVVTFAVPQFTSGLRPSQSLNPIVDPVSSSQTFFKVTQRARPWSIAEQFKEASGRILQTAPTETAVHTIGRVAPIVMALVIVAGLFSLVIARHDYARSMTDD